MPQLHEDLGTDCVCHGTCEPSADLFVRAINVAACTAGLFWFEGEDGRAVYFGFHESAGNEAQSRLQDFREWLTLRELLDANGHKTPMCSDLRLVRAVFGQRTPIYDACCNQLDLLADGRRSGWTVPPHKSRIVQDAKTIDFYPFSVPGGEVLVNGHGVQRYEDTMGYGS